MSAAKVVSAWLHSTDLERFAEGAFPDLTHCAQVNVAPQQRLHARHRVGRLALLQHAAQLTLVVCMQSLTLPKG